MDGRRFLFRAGFTNDIRFNNVNYYTLIADYRRYFRLHQRVSYALRVMALRSEGNEARRFYIGGSWTLRGYPRFRIWGKNVFLLNHELRFPLVDALGIQFPFGGIGFRQLRGALFVDAGNAWEDDIVGMRGSFGIGFRMNLGGFLVLRYDIGRRTDFNTIDDDTFYQFFFGWDY
jgi:outer membrane protein assembly factor BamA